MDWIFLAIVGGLAVASFAMTAGCERLRGKRQ